MQSTYEVKQIRKQLIAGALLALIILLVMHIFCNKRIKILSGKVTKLTNQINAQPKVDELTQQKSQSLIVSERLKSLALYQHYNQKLIFAVLNAIPVGICLIEFSRRQEKIVIQGRVDDHFILLTYLRMPQSYLQDIQLKQIKEKDELSFVINASQTKALPDLKMVDPAEPIKDTQENNASLL